MRRRFYTALKAFSLLLIVAVAASLGLLFTRGSKLLSVQSGSMAPSLKEGDLVSVRHVPLRDLAVGDIVTFINPLDQNQTITHRIVQILGEQDGPKSFVTKGDANVTTDIAVPQSEVLGKVQQRIPYLGYGIDFIRTLPGLILVIYLPILGIITSETKRLAAYYRRPKRYVDPEFAKQLKTGRKRPALLFGVATGLSLTMLIGIVVPVWAALQASATLTGNTISTVPGEEEPPGGNTCTNTNSVNVTSQTDQTASTGDATNTDNTNADSTSSGEASNTSSTNVSININNSCSNLPQ